MLWLVLTGALVSLLAWIGWSWRSRPPGPWGFPLLGCFPLLGPKPYLTFQAWAQKYGPVMSVSIGPESSVVLSDFKVFQEAFVKKGRAFNHRPKASLLRSKMKGLGILYNEGDVWTDHRRFTTMCLKNMGFGKNIMENHILDEACDLIQDMKSFDGHPFDPKFCVTSSVANVIWSVVAGRRFQRHDDKLIQLAKLNDTIIRTLGSGGILNFYPQLRFLFTHKFRAFSDAIDALKGFLLSEMNEHRRKDSSQEPPDLVHEYIQESERQQHKATVNTYTDNQIQAVLLDLFVAGVETTVTTLRWAFLLLMKYPLVQERVQMEIDEVVGSDRLPTSEDRLQMPCMEATIAEVQRFTCIIPTIYHCTSQDTEVGGYHVPKDTRVMGNIWSMHRDPAVWETPDQFNIQHFLDENGKLKKVESFVPFGIGKRACLGESLARMELFLILTCLLQKLTFKIPDGAVHSLEPNMGLALSPKEFEMCVQVR